MGRWRRTGILLSFLLLVLFTAAYVTAPGVMAALPGAYRVRLARLPLLLPLLDRALPPLPTALPPPAQVAEPPQITIPAIAPASKTPAATAAPTPTASQAAEQAGITAKRVEPTAAATAAVAPTATAAPIPLPRQARVEGLQIVPQGFNNCGPANLSLNLNFYGDATTQDEAAAILKPNREDRNVSPWQISDYVNEFTTLRSTAHSGGDLELIKRFVAAGFPIVIEKGYDPETDEGWLGHYLTVFGYDDEQELIYGMDTYLGPWDGSGRADSYEFVEQYWQQFNYTFYVVYPAEQEAVVDELLGPTLTEPVTMWQQAAQKAQAAIKVEPENAFAWFNLGTSLTRLGEMTGQAEYYENGAAAFDQARILGIPPRIVWYQFRPYIAYLNVGRTQDMLELAAVTLSTQGGRNVEETYFYQGHALAQQGDTAGAIAAYEEAIRLNENFYPAQWAIEQLATTDG